MKVLTHLCLICFVIWASELPCFAARTPEFEAAVTEFLKNLEPAPYYNDRFDDDRIERNNQRYEAVAKLGTLDDFKDSLRERLANESRVDEWGAILEASLEPDAKPGIDWLRRNLKKVFEARNSTLIKWSGSILREDGTPEDTKQFRMLAKELPAGLKDFALDLARSAEFRLYTRGLMKKEELKLLPAGAPASAEEKWDADHGIKQAVQPDISKTGPESSADRSQVETTGGTLPMFGWLAGAAMVLGLGIWRFWHRTSQS